MITMHARFQMSSLTLTWTLWSRLAIRHRMVQELSKRIFSKPSNAMFWTDIYSHTISVFQFRKNIRMQFISINKSVFQRNSIQHSVRSMAFEDKLQIVAKREFWIHVQVSTNTTTQTHWQSEWGNTYRWLDIRRLFGQRYGGRWWWRWHFRVLHRANATKSLEEI